jgi:hypothetical protein
MKIMFAIPSMAPRLHVFSSRPKTEEALMIKIEARIVCSAVASLFLTAAVWALPRAHSTAPTNPANQEAAPQTKSVTGKIASVAKNSFTLTVGSSASSLGQQLQQQTAPKTMNFLIDKNTTIEGKLQVGATADVTYREDNGNNIAISVRVGS